MTCIDKVDENFLAPAKNFCIYTKYPKIRLYSSCNVGMKADGENYNDNLLVIA